MLRVMGDVDARRFNVATHFGSTGELEVANIWLADEGTWDANPAEVAKTNNSQSRRIATSRTA